MRTKLFIWIFIFVLLSSFLSISVSAVDNNHSNNIVAWYLMNETAYKLRDSSVNNYNLSEGGSPTFHYENSTLAYYDFGANNYLNSTVVMNTSTFTYTIWFNATVPTTTRHLLNHNIGLSEQVAIYLHDSLPSIRITLEVDGSSKTISNISSTPYTNLLFHNYVVTYDGSNCRLYLDGVWQTSIGQTGQSDTGILNIGSNQALDAWWSGGVASVGIYNTTLTASQILALNSSGSYYNPFISAPPADTTPPVLSNYDMISDGGCVVWNTNISVECNTTDSTPTVTFDTDENAWCAISTNTGIGNVNYTNMTNARNCSGGEGSTAHTCTVTAGDDLGLGSGNVYLSCKDSNNNENITSSSGALAINFQGVNVYLVTPVDANISKNLTRDFKCNASSSSNLTNITLYIWNSTVEYYNSTKIVSNTFNESNWTISLAGSNYEWNCLAYDDIPISAWGSANYTLTIDSYFNVSLLEPADSLQTSNSTINFTSQLNILNYNVTNATLYIWYLNGTELSTNFTTLTGSTTQNVSFIVKNLIMFENYSWNYYACAEKRVSNSSECNWSITNRTFSILTRIDAESWENSTYETKNSTFQINITLPGGATLFATKLEHNNTNYTVSDISRTGSFYSLTKEIDIPLITSKRENITRQINFSWHFTYSGTIGFSNETTTSRMQNVSSILLTLCNSTYSTPAINFTLKDEEGNHPRIEGTNTTENGTWTANNTWATAWEYWLGSGSVYKTYNTFNTSTNSSDIDFCIYPINQSYNVDLDMEFESTGYISREYYLDDAVLTDDATLIDLYLLDEDEAVKFFFNLKTGYEDIVNAFITIAKYVVGDGTYLTIGKRKSDSDGNFIEYMDLDKTYQFTVVKDNSVLGILTKVSKCEEAPCKLYLNIEEAVTDVWGEYYDIYAMNVVYNLTYNATSKMITYIFIDVTGLAQYGRLKVDLIKYNESYSTVCDTQTYSAVGTLTCNLSAYDDGQFVAVAYISRSPELIVDKLAIIIARLAEVLGEHGLLVALFLIITVALVGAYNPVVGIVLALVALFVTATAGLVLLSVISLMFIITIGIILIIKMRS